MTRNVIRATSLAFAGIMIALVASAAPAASSDVCGQLITQDLKLTHDLVCSNNGFLIGASDVTIRLNGYSIVGPGRALPFNGILVADVEDVRIYGPGTIRNFRAGISIVSSSDVLVMGVEIRDNGLGFQPTSSAGIRISGSTAIWIVGNRITGNQDAGIDLTGSTRVYIAANLIDQNTAGVYFTDTVSVGNKVVGNVIQENTIGVRGSVVGNTVKGNKFLDNGADFGS